MTLIIHFQDRAGLPGRGPVRDGGERGVDDHDERKRVFRQSRQKSCKTKRRCSLQQVKTVRKVKQ